MKFLPLLALISAPAFAENINASEACPNLGEISAAIIDAYFAGVPLDQMMKIADGDQLLIDVTMDAYDEPRYSTAEVIAEATFDFRNRWEHECFRILNNQ